MVFYYLHKTSMEVLGFLMSLWFGRISNSEDENYQSSGSRRTACAHLRLGFAYHLISLSYGTYLSLYLTPDLGVTILFSSHPPLILWILSSFPFIQEKKKDQRRKTNSFGLVASYKTKTCSVPTRFLRFGDRVKGELTIEKELSKNNHNSLRACVYLGPDPLQLP